MKKTFLTVLLMGLIFNAFQCVATPAIKEVVAILPNMTTAQQVDSKLGKPDRIDKSLGQMIWYYNGDGYTLAVMWDMQTSRVTKYSFTSMAGRAGEWNESEAKGFVAGETTVENVLVQLGTPNDMSADRGKQQVQYIFKNNVLHLSFIDGKLKNYAVSLPSAAR